jgi:FkbM family methyltransferase
VGANIGLYSILFSQYTENTYSFEPTDTYENLLLPNLQKNNVTNLKTFKLALGEKSGNIDEKIYMIWGEQPVSNQYEFTTLDDFSNQHQVIPKFIKIDVDGFDFEVLKGGRNLLYNNNIIVCVEVNHALHTRGHKESDILDLMESLNYENFMILDNENYFFRKKTC